MQMFKESPLCQATNNRKLTMMETSLSAGLKGTHQLDCVHEPLSFSRSSWRAPPNRQRDQLLLLFVLGSISLYHC